MKSIRFISTVLFLSFIMFSCSDKEPEAFAYGNFESEDTFISSETSGRILEMKVNEGDRLMKGNLIAIIDTTQLYLKKLQLNAGRNAIESRIKQIEDQKKLVQVNKENLEKEIKRFGTLFLEKAATKKQLDDLEAQLEVLKVQMSGFDSQKKTIFAELKTMDVQIMQIDDQIEKSYISAPFDCNVIEKYARLGEMAPAGRKIIKVTDLSHLTLRVFVQGNQLSSLKLGDEIGVSYDGPEGLIKTTGKVIWISSEAEFTPKIIQTREDSVSMVYAVKIDVKNDGSLKTGMPGEINI